MRKLIILVIILFLFSQLTYAGNTGKIFGTVVDKSTGDPLAGVNVFLTGTTMGASTDLNGEFIILNIPPGKYSVECSYIGYTKVTMTEVRVQSDQTTILAFELGQETIELDEEIVVVADRPLVQADLTSSKKTTVAEEIAVLPVETYAGIMLTHAGVTQGAGGELHIRGGRSVETAYLIDGVSAGNPYSTNGLATQVATNAIQEMTVVSGAFNAEYGNAMSGVVNFVTKDGTPNFNLFISAYAGDFVSRHDDIFTNIDDVNPLANKNIEGTLSGPLSFLGKNNNFFLSARYEESEGYLYGIREHLPGDSANFETKFRTIQYKDDENKVVTIIEPYEEWYVELNGDNAFVPMNPSDKLNLLGKLKFQIDPSMVLRIQSVFNDSWSKGYVHSYKYVPDGISNYYSTGISNTLQFTHTLSPNTFYEIRGGFNYRDYKAYLYEDPEDPRYVPTDKIQGNPGGVTFSFGGNQMGHSYEKSNTYIFKGDFTSQIDKRNLFKAGLEGRLYELDYQSFTVQYDRNIYREPTIPSTSSTAHQIYNKFPRQFSAYAQDKLEYTDVIINAGLRYDYFFSDAEYAVDILQPDGERKKAQPHHMLAPRFGISFPVSATGFIHFSYGHFYQMPAMRNLYVNPEFILPVSGTTLFGNANLKPEQTITYELGLQQQFGDRIGIDITGFYKDVRDLLAWQTIQFRELGGDIRTYRMRMNMDYGNVRGLVFSLSKRMAPGDPIAAKIDYTFMVSEGNDNSSSAFYYNSLSGREAIKKILPLDWDQAHNLYASVTVNLFDRLNLGMIGKLSTGYPYSPQFVFSNYDAEVNSDRKPTYKTVDLRASYRFTISDITYQVFLKIYNLFDTLNERYVFDDTGRATYTFANRVVNEPTSFKSHYGEPGIHTYDEYNIIPTYYRAPRRIHFGFSVDF